MIREEANILGGTGRLCGYCAKEVPETETLESHLLVAHGMRKFADCLIAMRDDRKVWECCPHPHSEHELTPVGNRDVSIRCKHCECVSLVPVRCSPRIAAEDHLDRVAAQWLKKSQEDLAEMLRAVDAEARDDERERIALNLETGAAVALGLDETASAFLRAAAEHVRNGS